MKRNITLLAVSLIFISSHIFAQARADTSLAGETAYTTFTEDGAWCWFSDPRAIHYQDKYNRTYAGWMDQQGNVTVGYYDHDKKVIRKSVLHKNLEVDDHDNPSLFFDKDGKLMIFYSQHARNTPIYLMRSKNAESIDAWEPRQELWVNDTTLHPEYSKTYTYTNICQLSEENDKLYLFWRGMDFKPNFSVSEDGGKSWSTGKILILPDRIYRNRRPYIKVSTNHKDKIFFAFTDGHPLNEPTNSIYFMYYQNGAFHKANGEKIQNLADVPIQPEATDVVYDAKITGEKAWIWDVAYDREEHPVLVYARFKTDTTHMYYYARWNGQQWENHKITDAGSWFPHTPEGEKEREVNYSGGIVLDHENPNTVYLSREVNGIFEIERWTSEDGGAHWSSQPITQNSSQDNVRPFAVRHASEGNPLQVLWMNLTRYVHYTDYASAIKMDLKK